MQENQFKDEQAIEAAWKPLFYLGGISILLMVILFRRNFGIELMTFNGFGLFTMPEVPPVNAGDWFALFNNNWFVGLALFGLIDLVNYALVGIVFLALYGALHTVNKSAMVIATACSFVSITIYFATNQAFSMLTLSHRYAAATTVEQQAAFQAAGEALLASYNPLAIEQGTGFYASYLLILLAGLIVSIVMLRSTTFNKATAYTGILANGIGLGYFIVLIFAQDLLALPHSISALFRMVWYILIAIHLFRLGRRIGAQNQAVVAL